MNAVSLVILSILAQTSAPTPEQEAKAKAQVVLKEGAQLYQHGAYADALEKFEQAYSVFPSPKLFFNIGQANRELGRPAEAVVAFERFIAEVVDASPELLSEAKRSVNELAPKIGKLIIDCDVTGAENHGGWEGRREGTPRRLDSREPRESPGYRNQSDNNASGPDRGRCRRDHSDPHAPTSQSRA